VSSADDDIGNWEMMKALKVKAKATKTCAQCGQKLTGRAKFYCIDGACSDVFYVRFWGLPFHWIRPYILERDNHICRNCGQECSVAIQKRVYGRAEYGVFCSCEVDHIIEQNEGGRNEGSNLQTLCHKCHVAKTTKYLQTLRPKQVIERKRKTVVPLEVFT